MHDWRNFNDISFERTMIILYDNSMIIIIHPTTWSQHAFVLGFFFFFFFFFWGGRSVYHDNHNFMQHNIAQQYCLQ